MPLLCILVIFLLQQGRKEDLKSVVEHLRKRYSVQYIYCWHGGCGERDGWMDGRMHGLHENVSGTSHRPAFCRLPTAPLFALTMTLTASSPACLPACLPACPPARRPVGVLERSVAHRPGHGAVRPGAVLPQAHARAQRD